MADVVARGGRLGRVVFVDQARALAIVLMLVGHSLDQFLGEPARSGAVYQEYQFVRGINMRYHCICINVSLCWVSGPCWEPWRFHAQKF